MNVFLPVLAIFLLASLGMGIGYILKNRCLQGSCGGLSSMRDENGKSICEACQNPSPECAEKLQTAAEQPEPAVTTES